MLSKQQALSWVLARKSTMIGIHWRTASILFAGVGPVQFLWSSFVLPWHSSYLKRRFNMKLRCPKVNNILTLPYSFRRITTRRTRLFLDVKGWPATTTTQGVCLIMPFSKRRGTFSLNTLGKLLNCSRRMDIVSTYHLEIIEDTRIASTNSAFCLGKGSRFRGVV